jgi:ribonucleotide reductase alpha subunit
MDDNLEHIYKTNMQCALISKFGGGIGIDISRVRSKGSIIRSTNGVSDGIVPMIKVFNATANYCNQQGRRKGSIAMYLQPWHPDILEFLALRYNNPPEELRARELFTAMWIPDIFMRRVEADDIWSLIDPNVVRELCDTYGKDFDKIYEQAEKENRAYVKSKGVKLSSHASSSNLGSGAGWHRGRKDGERVGLTAGRALGYKK